MQFRTVKLTVTTKSLVSVSSNKKEAFHSWPMFTEFIAAKGGDTITGTVLGFTITQVL